MLVALFAVLPARGFAQDPAAGVRISEFVSNPAEDGNDGAYEWVEIENTGTEPVDLAGWRIGDDKLLDDLVTPGVLAPGARAVIAGKSYNPPPGAIVIRLRDGLIGGGLNNGGDTIRLLDASGATVDSVTFGPGGIVPPGVGESLARNRASAWRLSDYPTPGETNAFIAATAISDRFPVPVEYQDSNPATSPVAWIVLATCASAGAYGLFLLGRRAVTTHRRAHAA